MDILSAGYPPTVRCGRRGEARTAIGPRTCPRAKRSTASAGLAEYAHGQPGSVKWVISIVFIALYTSTRLRKLRKPSVKNNAQKPTSTG